MVACMGFIILGIISEYSSRVPKGLKTGRKLTFACLQSTVGVFQPTTVATSGLGTGMTLAHSVTASKGSVQSL